MTAIPTWLQSFLDSSHRRSTAFCILVAVVAHFALEACVQREGLRPLLLGVIDRNTTEIAGSTLTLSVTLVGFSMTVATMTWALGLLPAAEKLQRKEDWISLPRVMMLPVWFFLAASVLAIVTMAMDIVWEDGSDGLRHLLLFVISVAIGGAAALVNSVKYQAGLFSVAAKGQQTGAREKQSYEIEDGANEATRSQSRRRLGG